MTTTKEVIIEGVPICRGVAIGKPYVFTVIDEVIPERTISDDNVQAEIARYRRAILRSKEEISKLKKQLEQESMFEGASILEAQLHIIQDSKLTTQIENEIRSTHKNAESVFQSVFSQYQDKFTALADSFFRERFQDIQDAFRRIMSHLRSNARASLSQLPPNSIIFSRELTTSDTAEANIACASGFVTETGGATSHAAIVARARGTPYVSNISFDKIDANLHKLVIIDGRTGEIILSPTAKTLARYEQVQNQLRTHITKLNHISALPAETIDGFSIRLSANIEMASELEMLHQHGGHGVGLFRSEYICLTKDCFPTEEEQYLIYREIVEKMLGLPIVIRTFDVGGDKGMPNQQTTTYEANPFLGCRAIRFLLKEPEIFKTQLCAILRASRFGDVSIMFPMVSTLSELREAKKMVQEAQRELTQRRVKFGKVRIGCMIEVPSAAIIADLLAKECDFLSVGTNDLVQYALAVDRSNHTMSNLYTPTHPSVIRMIKLIVHEANAHGIPVTLCGEMAADPRCTPLLLGLGVHALSVATRYIPTVKHAIRHTSIVAASQLMEKALKLTTADEIQDLLTREYKKNVPDDCFYNC